MRRQASIESSADLAHNASEYGQRSSAMRVSYGSAYSDLSPAPSIDSSSRRFLPHVEPGPTTPLAPTASERYALPTDTKLWAHDDSPEADDYLHDPVPKRGKRIDSTGSIFTFRGLANLGCLTLLILALVMLFAGYPVYSALATKTTSTTAGFSLGGVNGSGQVPQTVGNFGLIDEDTPKSAYSFVSDEGPTWDLVFSDEFEQEGRTFYPGDDPYWEAADFHAWATGDLEYYDPRQLSTKNGSLVIELANITNHDLYYMGGSLQSWNKFCFTGGRLEAKVQLPGSAKVAGLWPAFWTMGNLGRVGYGGTLDGMWPYSYDVCDYGTLPNQTLDSLPKIALTSGTYIGDGLEYPYALSYLPGQRLSRCTCENDESHPGPKHSDGTWVGRSAPEIDVFEAQVDSTAQLGQVSQSGQWAPFNPYYVWENATHGIIVNDTISHLNSYQGGDLQQTSSVVSDTNQDCYEYDSNGNAGGCYSVYAIEYLPGDEGYMKWFNDDKLMWTYKAGGFPANAEAMVGYRDIPKEPMYILMNLALSTNFGAIDYDGLASLWPVHMSFEYVRVYQDPSRKNIGCDPDDFPTAEYIARFPEGYSNPNITTWAQMTDTAKPINNLTGTCS